MVRKWSRPISFLHSFFQFLPVQGCGALWFPRETAQRDSVGDSSGQLAHLVQLSLLSWLKCHPLLWLPQALCCCATDTTRAIFRSLHLSLLESKCTCQRTP